MRKIKLYKGGEQMKTLTRNRNLTRHVDGELTQEQLDQIIPILEQIRYRREVLGIKGYTLEEAMQILNNALEEE